jgi:hypothetical protein
VWHSLCLESVLECQDAHKRQTTLQLHYTQQREGAESGGEDKYKNVERGEPFSQSCYIGDMHINVNLKSSTLFRSYLKSSVYAVSTHSMGGFSPLPSATSVGASSLAPHASTRRPLLVWLCRAWEREGGRDDGRHTRGDTRLSGAPLHSNTQGPDEPSPCIDRQRRGERGLGKGTRYAALDVVDSGANAWCSNQFGFG